MEDREGQNGVIEYLESLKSKDRYFQYFISCNNDQEVNGIVWMTRYMREFWIRYGDIIFLDSKKKQLNKLCWPYIGPCGVDNENRVCVFCESLML